MAADGDVTMSVSGMTTKMSDGTWSITINSNGRVSSLQRKGTEFLSSNGIYFDYTTSEGNKGLSPSKVTVIKNTAEHCEVLYSATSGNTIFEQGFIMRKGVPGLYSYVIATGTATSASEPIKEARVCARLSDNMLNGYVDWRMNGRIPSNSEMATAEKEENTIQDATYYLGDDGARKTGLLTVDGSTYYMNSDAVMQTGLITVDGAMHYFDSKGVMQTGWVESGDARYYFDGDGNAVSGWKNLDNKWCWFDGNGKYDPGRKYDSAPMVALTFDDGPGEYTNQILDLLGKYNVKATFFMIGNQVSDFSSAVKREHDMGMEQGNHSWDHKTLTHLTAEQISSEISRTNDVIRSVTGSNPTLFRPPGGGYNDLVIANSFGMPMIMWSIDTLDWSHKNAQTTYDTVMNSVQDGDVILMHEIYEQSYIAAQMLIPALLERGFRLVTVSELAAQRGHTLRSGISYGRLN